MEQVIWSPALRKEVKKIKATVSNTRMREEASSPALSVRENQALRVLRTSKIHDKEIPQGMWW